MSTDQFNQQQIADLKDFIRAADEATEMRIENKARKWFIGQIISLIPIIFLLGGIYSNGNAAVVMLQETQKELAQRQIWMSEREKWEAAIEAQWPPTKPFKSPKSTREGS